MTADRLARQGGMSMTAKRKPFGEVECLLLGGSCRSAKVGPSMPAVDPSAAGHERRLLGGQLRCAERPSRQKFPGIGTRPSKDIIHSGPRAPLKRAVEILKSWRRYPLPFANWSVRPSLSPLPRRPRYSSSSATVVELTPEPAYAQKSEPFGLQLCQPLREQICPIHSANQT